MTALSLREAAQQTGANKSTIWRAIKSGRMSANRLDDGGFAIDPAELFRVFPPQPSERQDATADSVAQWPASRATDKNKIAELTAKLAAADAAIAGLRELIAEVRQSRDACQAQAEDWKTQAGRLTLALPAPAPGPVATPASRPWWRFWRRSAG